MLVERRIGLSWEKQRRDGSFRDAKGLRRGRKKEFGGGQEKKGG